MTDAEQRVVMFIWEDCRALIGALKLQRWDVCKWAVTINLTIAAASIALKELFWVFTFMAVFVAASGTFLIVAYNRRITGARNRLTSVTAYAGKHMFDFNSALGTDIGKPKDSEHDRDELWVFWAAALVSAVPSLAIWIFNDF